LEKALKNPVMVVNKTGGGGTVCATAIKNSKADGYTLGTVSVSTMCIIPHFRELPYNPREDFTPVVMFGGWGFTLGVRPDSPWNTVKDLIEYARRHPEEVTFGTAGVGIAPHLFMEQLALKEKVKMKHVPFPGGAAAISALMGGHIKAALVAEVAQQTRAGNVKSLAVVTEERMKTIPEVPTFRELGYDLECPSWVGFATPKGVPEPVLQVLEKSLAEGIKDPSFNEILYKFEMIPMYKNRENFSKQITIDYDRLGSLIKELGIRVK
jgi:tripartite-type tricarboxylate transporter receptor subunit TctC